MLTEDIVTWIRVRMFKMRDDYLRLHPDLTITEFPTRARISKAYMYKLENTDTVPSVEVLIKWTAACGSNIAEFFMPLLDKKSAAELAQQNTTIEFLRENYRQPDFAKVINDAADWIRTALNQAQLRRSSGRKRGSA